MTKQQLLDKLQANALRVETPQKLESSSGFQRYIVGVWKGGEDAINRHNTAFFVENDGEENEVAYWEQSNPVPELPEQVETFSQKVNNLISSKISDGTIKGAVIESVNETGRTAYVRALVGTAQKFAFVTDTNNDGTLEITLL